MAETLSKALTKTIQKSGRSLRALLTGGSRTNLVIRSQEFDSASWTSIGTPVTTANTTAAPDGTLTADTVADTDAAGISGRRITMAVPNDTTLYCASIYILKTTGAPAVFPNFALAFLGGTGRTSSISINTTTGAWVSSATAGSTNNVTVESAGAYWRVSVTAQNNASGNTSLLVTLYPANSATLTVTGANANTGSQVVWGAQVESGRDYPSKYIPTAGTAVTAGY